MPFIGFLLPNKKCIMIKFNFRLCLIALLSLAFIKCSSVSSEEDAKKGEEGILDSSSLIYEGESPSDRLSDNESNFYTNKITNTVVVATLNGDCSTEDSELLNQQIANLSNNGGGVIRITKGTYCLKEVLLRSNIHIKIDSDVTIQPDLTGYVAGKNLNMFLVGEDFYVENVAITNSDEDNTDVSTWFKGFIPAGDNIGVRFIEFGNVKNFKFSGLRLTDNYSKFSNIVLNFPSSENADELSRDGIIKDIVMTGMHVGYGVVQMQTGKNILYNNIDGQGGITLRIETDVSSRIVKENKPTVDGVVGRNIVSRFGDAALNMSPRRIDQGRVDIDGITAINSTHAVQIAAGYMNDKVTTATIINNGTFSTKSYIGDITVTGGKGAQIKGKDFKYFNCDDREELILKCYNPDNESTPGISIGVIRNSAAAEEGCNSEDNGCYKIIIGRITKTNTDFEQDDFFTYPTDAIGGCSKVTKPSDGSCN